MKQKYKNLILSGAASLAIVVACSNWLLSLPDSNGRVPEWIFGATIISGIGIFFIFWIGLYIGLEQLKTKESWIVSIAVISITIFINIIVIIENPMYRIGWIILPLFAIILLAIIISYLLNYRTSKNEE